MKVPTPMETSHPTAQRYLEALERGLSAMASADRREVVSEIRAHLHDAQVAGQPLADVLTRLGPAESLANAYLVESYLNPQPAGATWIRRGLGLAGLVVFGSLPTVLLTSVLGSIGVAFLAAGPALFAAGVCGLFGVSLAPVVQTDLKPWQSILLGPAMGAVGALCLWLMYRYLRWMVCILRLVALGC